MLIESIIGALIPIGAEAVKQAASKWFGNSVKPTTIAEQIQLDDSEVNRIKAVAELDKPIGQPSQWVIDLRASARYIGALVVIAVGLSTMYFPGIEEAVKIVGLEAANIAFGFLFGSRITATWSKR